MDRSLLASDKSYPKPLFLSINSIPQQGYKKDIDFFTIKNKNGRKTKTERSVGLFQSLNFNTETVNIIVEKSLGKYRSIN